LKSKKKSERESAGGKVGNRMRDKGIPGLKIQLVILVLVCWDEGKAMGKRSVSLGVLQREETAFDF
jgi:hypothetical protein